MEGFLVWEPRTTTQTALVYIHKLRHFPSGFAIVSESLNKWTLKRQYDRASVCLWIKTQHGVIFSGRNKETTWMPLLPGIQKHKLCLALKITFKSNKNEEMGWGRVRGRGGGGVSRTGVSP